MPSVQMRRSAGSSVPKVWADAEGATASTSDAASANL